MKKFKTIIALGLVGLVTVACMPKQEKSTDQKQRQQTERMVKEANNRVGMPGITNFTEKRFAKMIYELRDSEITTYTYFVDMNGQKHFLCESIGYGLPYSVQYVNPERVLHGAGANGRSAATIAQPEPNGLFMPDSLSATWVLCSVNGEVKPVYSEPSLLVSPFKLH